MDGVPLPDPPKRRLDREVRLVLAAMTLVALIVALWATRTVNPLRGDSGEYLFFDPSRSVGYPAFLWLIRLITGHIAAAVPAQMLLLAGSLTVLGWSFHRFCGRPATSFVFQAILLSQIVLWKASALLMTEAVAAALVALWCAQILRMLKSPSARGLVALVTISALATMVHPSLVTLFFGSALFMVFAQGKGRRWPALIMAGAGLVLAWAATPVAQLLVHGSAQTTSPVARGVLQHSLFCDPGAVPADPDSRFVEQRAASVRRYIETAPSDMQEPFRRAYSTPLRFGLIIPVLGQRHHFDRRSDADPYLSRIAAERVKANPLCYARSVVGAYYRMATFGTYRTTQQARRMREFMASHPPVELPQYPVLRRDEQMARAAANEAHGEVSGLNPDRQQLSVDGKAPFLALMPIRLLYAAAALVGLLSLAALAARRRFAVESRKAIAATAAMGLVFHGTLAVTALVELGLSRYSIPLWPLVCTVIAVALVRVIERAPRSSPVMAITGSLRPQLGTAAT